MIDNTPITPSWKQQHAMPDTLAARIAGGYAAHGAADLDEQDIADEAAAIVAARKADAEASLALHRDANAEPLVLTGQGDYAEGSDGNAFAGLVVGVAIVAGVGAAVWAIWRAMVG